ALVLRPGGLLQTRPRLPVLRVLQQPPLRKRPHLRDRMLEAACARLRAEGIELLATESYPMSGEDVGYTVALIFHAPAEEQQRRVTEVLDDAFMEALRSRASESAS